MDNETMTVTFYSNFLMHHQLPFCLEMVKRLGEKFIFVATERMDVNLKAFWKSEEMNSKYPFVLKAYEDEASQQRALELARDSNVVIVGSAPEIYIRERMKINKLTFRYIERPLKKGRKQLFNLHKLNVMLKSHTAYIGKKLYLLCASAYTAGDCALVGGYWGKAYRWGYFTEVRTYNLDTLFSHKRVNGTVSILWTGRLIGLKHPDVSILLAEKLKKEGYSFHLNIIGDGELKDNLLRLIKEKKLHEHVNLLGSMTPEAVRDYMEAADIYLFTSDHNEGWGAVLNESMNSACAVVADRHIGSVPFLIKDGINGWIYDGTFDDFYKKVKRCMDSRELMQQLGTEAYRTIVKQWNPSVAAERILALSNALLQGMKYNCEEGPCSHAKWM